MFTGIVEELGLVTDVHWLAEGADSAARFTVAGNVVTADAVAGDSIAVSGVCLTVVEVGDACFTADVMRETLVRTTLVDATVGTPVNLERAATLQTRLGGHLMQGHVDAVGSILDRATTPHWEIVTIALPEQLARYVVEKGSIAVDGVSLTTVEAGAASFTVSLIPTTLERTTLGAKAVGEAVNLEVDVMAKYAERLLASTARAMAPWASDQEAVR